MTVGTYIEQLQRTKETPELDLEYYGICLFGEINQINELTRKFLFGNNMEDVYTKIKKYFTTNNIVFRKLNIQ